MGAAALIAIVVGTFASEDVTAIAVGLGVREGSLPLVPAVVACVVGIYLGDIGLWAAGRFGGRRVLEWRIVSRMPLGAFRTLGRWIDAHPGPAIVGSRFLPGTRLPLYVAAGVWGTRPWRFFFWMAIAVAMWTPLLVVGVMCVGDGAARLFDVNPIARVALQLTAGAVCLGLLQALRLLSSRDSRRRLSLVFARLRRWEFWPSWAVYAPVVTWIASLAIRYRSLTVFTAVNPRIEHSGFVGESKSAILATLPQVWVMPWAVVEAGDAAGRVDAVQSTLADRGWAFPLVAKPDVGQRGVGVQWLHSVDDVRRYVATMPGRIVLQLPHSGPYEAGVFYVRMPGAQSGYVFSITDKRFPVLTGDGRSTVEELIFAHPRFRLQASIFLARHQANRECVLAPGERLAIGQIGNHSQGAEFLDGRDLWTPALEALIDDIARTSDVYFGRFDVRYSDVDAFKAGRDLAILELNGVTSEATHIYGGTLWQAWKTLMKQWSLAFAIGAANRTRGYQPTTVLRLLDLTAGFLRGGSC